MDANCSVNGKKSSKLADQSVIQIDDELEEGEISEPNGDQSPNSVEVIGSNGEDDDLFEHDVNPVNENANDAFVKATEMSHLNRAMVGLEPVGTPVPNKSTPRGGVCFNCSGPHSLNECPEPRDNRRISRNRSFHTQRRGDSQRMHTNNQTSEYKPGVISDNLRRALGIEKLDIPEWIFRMRDKGQYRGYPPGYLNEALEADTIPFLEGNDSNKKKHIIKINTERLIRYPGFNSYDPVLKDIPKHERPYRIPTFDAFKNDFPKWVQENIKPTEDDVQEVVSHKKSGKAKENRTSDDKEVELELIEPTPSADLKIDISETPPSDIVSTPAASRSKSEITAIPGTPIMIDRIDALKQNEPKPDLVKFAEGIVPFQAREENDGKKGFIKDMMQMLDEYRKKK